MSIFWTAILPNGPWTDKVAPHVVEGNTRKAETRAALGGRDLTPGDEESPCSPF